MQVVIGGDKRDSSGGGREKLMEEGEVERGLSVVDGRRREKGRERKTGRDERRGRGLLRWKMRKAEKKLPLEENVKKVSR